MATKKAGTSVAKTGNKSMTFGESAGDHIKTGHGRGNENVTTSDMVIPRLEIIQSQSPQKDKKAAEYINGAEEGDIFNTVSNSILARPAIIVPVLFKKEWMLWVPRDEGGGGGQGFRGAFDTEAEARDMQAELAETGGSKRKGEETELVDAHQHFVLIVNGDEIEEAVITMTRTKMKVSRKWNSIIRMAGGDRFSRGYYLDTVEESNPKGSYYNFAIESVGFSPEPVYARAEALYEAIATGKRSIHREAADGETEADI